MKRLLVLGLVLMTGAVATTAAQLLPPTPAGPQGGRPGGPGGRGGAGITGIDKVADNLYLIQGAGGNTAAFVTANGVVLVDTKNPNNGQGILDQVKTVTDKPVTHIINTHTHADHTGSNAQFPATVEIVTHENTAANMAKMKNFAEDATRHGLPDRTYKDRLTLLSGNDSIDLYYFGPAHTGGDTFVVFRNLRVMHAGDVFAQKGLPLVDAANGGSGIQYPETIAKAVAGIKGVERVIPGHINGPTAANAVQTWQDFADYGEFTGLFVTAARDAAKTGKSAQQAAAELKLPEKFKDYSMTGFRGGPDANLNTIMEELKTAK